VLHEAADEASYHGDEALEVANTRYFDFVFLQHDIVRSEWSDNYWVHTQPMLTRYLLGGWLRSRGYSLDVIPQVDDVAKNPGDERLEQKLRSDSLLAQARLPMVILTAGTATLLYHLGRQHGSVVGGLTAAALMLASPLVRESLVRAVPDAPLMFFVVLSLLLGVLGARRGSAAGLPLGWAVGLGITLGLALSSKLTAVFSLAAILVWGALMVWSAWRSAASAAGGALGRMWAAGRGWALALVLAYGVFVVTDPHLYSDPLLHTQHLVDSRLSEMSRKSAPGLSFAVPNPLDRPGYVLMGSLVSGTISGSHRLTRLLEAGLATIGAAALLLKTWRSWRRGGQIPATGLVLITTVIYFVGVSAGLTLSFPRYWVPTLIIGTLLSGSGVSSLVALLLRLRTASHLRIARSRNWA